MVFMGFLVPTLYEQRLGPSEGPGAAPAWQDFCQNQPRHFRHHMRSLLGPTSF